jgi:hypothetical protein
LRRYVGSPLSGLDLGRTPHAPPVSGVTTRPRSCGAGSARQRRSAAGPRGQRQVVAKYLPSRWRLVPGRTDEHGPVAEVEKIMDERPQAGQDHGIAARDRDASDRTHRHRPTSHTGYPSRKDLAPPTHQPDGEEAQAGGYDTRKQQVPAVLGPWMLTTPQQRARHTAEEERSAARARR